MVRALTPLDGEGEADPIRTLMGHVTRILDEVEALEALAYAKSNKRFPTYALVQKVCNKARQLQSVEGFTKFSPIWNNRYYLELQLC